VNTAAGLFAVFCAAAGIIALKIKTWRRRKFFTEYLSFVQKFRIISGASMESLSTVLRSSAALSGADRGLEFILKSADITDCGGDFAQTWRAEFALEKTELSRADRVFVESFADIVGKSDVDTQDRMLDIYIRQCGEINEKIAEYENKTLVSQCAGIAFAGAAAALLIL